MLAQYKMMQETLSSHKLLLINAIKCCACTQVIVVEDDNGNIVRETMKDNDVLAQYKTMRETLVYLCHLDYEDTEHQMLERLRMQVRGRVCLCLYVRVCFVFCVCVCKRRC